MALDVSLLGVTARPTPKPSTPMAASSSATVDRAVANRTNPPTTMVALPARNSSSITRTGAWQPTMTARCAPLLTGHVSLAAILAGAAGFRQERLAHILKLSQVRPGDHPDRIV